MKKQKLSYLLLPLVILLVALGGCQNQEESESELKPLNIRLVVDDDIRSVASELVRRFHNLDPKLSDNRPILIELENGSGIQTAKQLASGELKTELWISPFPALKGWINTHLENLGARQDECKPLFVSPLVFAAVADSTPHSTEYAVSWDQLFPDEGQAIGNALLQLEPESSSMGLLSYLQLYLLASDKVGSQEIDNATLTKLKSMSSRVSQYGSTPQALLTKISIPRKQNLLALLPAHLIEKQDKEQYTLLNPINQLSLTYEVCISQADWITHAHRAGIREFFNFLDGDSTLEFLETLRADTEQVQVEQPDITPAIVDQLLSSWPSIRRPAQFMFMVDRSASMEDGGLDATKRAIRTLIARAGTEDKFSIISFATSTRMDQEFSSDKMETIAKLDRLEPLGGSSIYDGIRESFSFVLEQAPEENYRKVFILVSDGDDLNSRTSLELLTSVLREHRKNMHYQLIVFGLTNVKPKHEDLSQIASTAGGEYYEIPIAHLEQMMEQALRN